MRFSVTMSSPNSITNRKEVSFMLKGDSLEEALKDLTVKVFEMKRIPKPYPFYRKLLRKMYSLLDRMETTYPEEVK